MLSGEHRLTTIVNDENHRNGFRSPWSGRADGRELRHRQRARVGVQENLGMIMSDVDHHNETDSTAEKFLIAIIMRILRLIH
jgi:hypothetical protein